MRRTEIEANNVYTATSSQVVEYFNSFKIFISLRKDQIFQDVERRSDADSINTRWSSIRFQGWGTNFKKKNPNYKKRTVPIEDVASREDSLTQKNRHRFIRCFSRRRVECQLSSFFRFQID